MLSLFTCSRAIIKESILSVESRSAGGYKFSEEEKAIFVAQKSVKKSRTSRSDISLNLFFSTVSGTDFFFGDLFLFFRGTGYYDALLSLGFLIEALFSATTCFGITTFCSSGLLTSVGFLPTSFRDGSDVKSSLTSVFV